MAAETVDSKKTTLEFAASKTNGLEVPVIVMQLVEHILEMTLSPLETTIG